MTQLIRVKPLQDGDTIEILKYSGDWFPLTHCLRRIRCSYTKVTDRETSPHVVELQQFTSEREAFEEFDRR